MHATIGHHLQISYSQTSVVNSLYDRARKRGQQGQLWAGLMGRSQRLPALGEFRAACPIEPQSDGELCTVSIDRIRASEARSADFDRDFNPLQDHTRDRWLSIARAREQGKALPPVALISLGDLYAVRDGHHRISVARALGQKSIEAKVIVWQANPLLSSDQQGQPAGLRLEGPSWHLRRTAVRLCGHARRSWRSLVDAIRLGIRKPGCAATGC